VPERGVSLAHLSSAFVAGIIDILGHVASSAIMELNRKENNNTINYNIKLQMWRVPTSCF
jgi:hypothetical protein